MFIRHGLGEVGFVRPSVTAMLNDDGKERLMREENSRGGGLLWLGILVLIAAGLAVAAHFSPDFGDILGQIIEAVVGIIIGIFAAVVGVLAALIGILAGVFGILLGVFAAVASIVLVILPFLIPVVILIAIGFAIGRSRRKG